MAGNEKAVVLLSGGIDSATTLAVAKSRGFDVLALTVLYGQRHKVELESAYKVAASLGVREHQVLVMDLRWVGGSALTADLKVPKDRDAGLISREIPVTYVPARNTIFLSLALAWAEVKGARDLFIGVNALDYSGYPDCRPEFIQAFEHAANLGTRAGIGGQRFKIHTPLIAKTKAEIIKLAVELGLDLGLTHSCYDPDENGLACGRCDSCLLRKKGFAQAGVPDPTRYIK